MWEPLFQVIHTRICWNKITHPCRHFHFFLIKNNYISYLNKYTFELHPICLSNLNAFIHSSTQTLFISFVGLTNSLVTNLFSLGRLVPAFICEINPFFFFCLPFFFSPNTEWHMKENSQKNPGPELDLGQMRAEKAVFHFLSKYTSWF